MKRYHLMLICGLLTYATSKCENAYVQIGPLINYGITTLNTSQIGTGINATFIRRGSGWITAYGDALLMLHAGRTEKFSNYSYGAWHSQFGVGIHMNMIGKGANTMLYTLLGGNFNLSKTIFINNNEPLNTRNCSFYPGIVTGIGSWFKWGGTQKIGFEARYNLLLSDYFDAISTSTSKHHHDAFVTLCFKIELPIQ